jgi:thioredoxin reductase
MATAIQLKRYGIDPIILERKEIGGLLKDAYLVENYPGFPKGIPGLELIALLKQQLDTCGAVVCSEEVQELCYEDNVFIVKTAQQERECDIVVIASGTKPSVLTGLDVSQQAEKRVVYEVGQLRHTAHEKIAIIGAGDAAFDYALNLSEKNHVTILNRGTTVKCLPVLEKRVHNRENIEYKTDTQIKSIASRGQELVLACANASSQWDMTVSYLLVAIGREPCLDFVTSSVEKNLESLQMRKKLFMVGDVQNDRYRQTAIAVGDGVKCAMEIHNIIKESTCA